MALISLFSVSVASALFAHVQAVLIHSNYKKKPSSPKKSAVLLYFDLFWTVNVQSSYKSYVDKAIFIVFYTLE